MSKGEFNYFQYRYEWDEIKYTLSSHIDKNPNNFNQETLNFFKEFLLKINSFQNNLNLLDSLISGGISEETFFKKTEEL